MASSRYALLSVSDKSGIVDFARALTGLDFTIVSTGGTHRVLAEAGVTPLVEVADFTGFPEGMNGRIKTLTPQVFGGVLALRDNPEHLEFLQANDLPLIDLVVVNLYPFHGTYFDDSKTFAEKVEQIDIGGPSMIRAAAKNYQYCAPVVDPNDYGQIITEYQTAGDLSVELRKELAAKTFAMTAHYDLLIAKLWKENSPLHTLRYGENPHQSAVVLTNPFSVGASLTRAVVHQGKALSYNNLSDSQGALELALSAPADVPFATVIKHATPCGAATGDTLRQALDKAHACDPVSAFGGIIALNQTVDQATAEKLVSWFNEIVIAPGYTPEALTVLAGKKNVRVLEITDWAQTADVTVKSVRGGTLVQDLDVKTITEGDLTHVTDQHPTPDQVADMVAGWPMVKMVKSNAIVVVKDGAMVGKGGGCTSRVEAMEIALNMAGDAAQGAVIISDAFFPFPDNIALAKAAGIAAVVQPGGSKNDDKVIAAANEAGIAMSFTGTRAFLH